MATKKSLPDPQPLEAGDQKFELIKLNNIEPDPNQPRKFFHEGELQELIDSIRENGVIQPILVRPKGKSYMIVCGERRYKASCAVQAIFKSRYTIPCIVRQMDDQKALELQVIENLQRKDVHPIEEGQAYWSLRQKGANLEEISLRVGKSIKYVARRLQLTELIDEFQQLAFDGHLDITDALELSRLIKDSQKLIYENCVTKNKKGEVTVSNMSWKINEAKNDLSRAKFDIKSKTLLPMAGSCTSCLKNSANTPDLFDSKSKTCLDPWCFKIKTQNHILEKAKEYVESGCFVVAPGSYHTEEEKAIIQNVKDNEIEIMSNSLYETAWNTEISEPDPYDEWYENNYDVYDEDDEDFPSKEDLQEAYEEYCNDVAEDNERIKADIKAGYLTKAFDVTDGKEIFIKLKAGIKETAGSTDTSVQIANLHLREARAKELDAEKIYEAVRKEFKPVIAEWVKSEPVDALENMTIILGAVLYKELSWSSQKELAEDLEQLIIKHSNTKKVDWENLDLPTQNGWLQIFITKVMQHYIADKCFTAYGSEKTSIVNFASMAWARILNTKLVENIEYSINEKATKRQANLEKKIESLLKQG